MPSYRVTAKGFYDGRLYDVTGKRTVLHTELPFKKVPSWLEPMEDKAPVSTRKVEGVKVPTSAELKEQLDGMGVEYPSRATIPVLTELLETAIAKKEVDDGKKDIEGASFLANQATVETL